MLPAKQRDTDGASVSSLSTSQQNGGNGRKVQPLLLATGGKDNFNHSSSFTEKDESLRGHYPQSRSGSRPENNNTDHIILSTSQSAESLNSTEQEEDLWRQVENIMSNKQEQVLCVLEDFGIADIEPSSDALEEQIWRVVQGETSLQEVMDLV